MQTRCYSRCAASEGTSEEDIKVLPEIMVPLVGTVKENELQRTIDSTAEKLLLRGAKVEVQGGYDD